MVTFVFGDVEMVVMTIRVAQNIKWLGTHFFQAKVAVRACECLGKFFWDVLA